MYRDHCAIGGGLESVDEDVVHLDAANTTQHGSNKERNNFKKKRKKNPVIYCALGPTLAASIIRMCIFNSRPKKNMQSAALFF